MHRFLAIDLGAESGRAILGVLDGDALTLEELHRFPNIPVRLPTGLYWDALRLFHEVLHALTMSGHGRKLRLDGIGVDTWGVDFALLGRDGALLDNPRHYRGSHTEGILEKASAVLPLQRIFAATGTQLTPLNSLYQWFALKLKSCSSFHCATRLLFMPDLFNYWLTGAQTTELTIASTSQMLASGSNYWARDLLISLGLPAQILAELNQPGTPLRTLLPEVAASTGLSPETLVYATASHDTASAVAAIPAKGEHWCYISSGTWSLMGVELSAPIINDAVHSLGFTNECGVQGKTLFLKNLPGLWLLQECRREWALSGYQFSYQELTELAASAPSSGLLLDPDEFTEPSRMPQQILDRYPVPDHPGSISRLILESLAHAYANVLDDLERLTGIAIRGIHIAGGGSRNTLLNQLTSTATRRTVIAGPAEATAIGNILVQAMGAGCVRDLEHARDIVRRSFPLTIYAPPETLE